MNIKSPDDIKRMRESGLLLWETHQVARQLVTAGVTTAEINAEVENFIAGRKAIALFKGVPGKIPYPAATCISVNEQVVHGIPSGRKLVNGDIVSIDIGVKLNGWCADAAVTYPVGTIESARQELLDVTEDFLREAIGLLASQTRWSGVVRKTVRNVHQAGFSIVEDLIGHGIGREMWEQPGVVNYFGIGIPDFRIKPGLVIAIEPMINMGTREIRTLADGWTIVTRDGLPSAHFEHSVAVTAHGPEVLTCGPNGEGWAM